jgi:hypothetical protein
MTSARHWAAQLYVKALRTGEPSTLVRLADHVANGAVLNTGKEEFTGKDAVLARVTGQWPQTSVYYQGAWRYPVEEGGKVTVGGSFPHLGAAPKAIELTFTFDGDDKIVRVDQISEAKAPLDPVTTIPDMARGLVNGALANGTPMVMACSDPNGKPLLSLRGSVQTYSETQLGVWLRNAKGGAVAALAANPQCALLYRDSRARITLNFEGLGKVSEDEGVRNRVFDMSPEVEQLHDPARKGAALIVDVVKLSGFTAAGMIRMTRPV